MKPGSWPSILGIYLFGVLGVACLSKMIPLAADFQRALGASPGTFALMMSLLALPAAILATIGGAFVDRVGPRRTLILAAVIGAVANLGYLLAPSVPVFLAVRLLEGLTMVGVFTSAPALIMATTEGRRRVSAMTLWSTYTPTGFSLGLLLAAGFAGTPDWRVTFALHGGLFVLAALLGLALPQAAPAARSGPAPSWSSRLADLLAAYGQPGPVRLALAFGMVISIGLGTSTIIPSRLAQLEHIPIGQASAILAAANFTMILGALLTSTWLRRGGKARRLYLGLAAVGSIAGVVLFLPATGFPLEIVSLCVWLLATGGANAFTLAVLPAVVADPRKGAAAAGLFSQVSSLVTLLTPPIWIGVFSHGGWQAFIAMIICGWLLSLALLPPKAAAFRAAPAAA